MRTRFLFSWAMLLLGTAIFSPAQAGYKVLYDFGANGPSDGYDSMGRLVLDAQGNLYGTTAGGGSGASGTVFELSPSSGGVWTETILYNFCSQPNCLDGAGPGVGLVSDRAGNLYGSTLEGGASSLWGTVFELSPPSAPGGEWTETVLWSFGGISEGDGCFPRKLTFDAVGDLYGITSGCGTGAHASGTVFELTPSPGGKWAEVLLYTFNGTNKINPYGTDPVGGITFDDVGNIYGTTSFGGKLFGGTVYELSPNPGGGWSETVLHAFSPGNIFWPLSSLAFDGDGNLYGTANKGGGAGVGCASQGCGGIFRLTKTGGGWRKDSLSFTGLDGGNPVAGLILDQRHKTAYGTTQFGGANGNGTVFSAHGAKVNVLYSFCAQDNCADGSQPLTAITPDDSGNIYGTTSAGGAFNQGVVFEIVR